MKESIKLIKSTIKDENAIQTHYKSNIHDVLAAIHDVMRAEVDIVYNNIYIDVCNKVNELYNRGFSQKELHIVQHTNTITNEIALFVTYKGGFILDWETYEQCVERCEQLEDVE